MEVELVDASPWDDVVEDLLVSRGSSIDDDAAERAEHPDPAEGGRRGAAVVRRLRRARPQVLVAAGLALAVVVGANVVEGRAAAERRETLAAALGPVPSLAEPLEELWRAPGWYSGDAGEVLLVRSDTGISGLDPATGAVVWSRTDAAGDPELGETQEYCAPVGERARDLGLTVDATGRQSVAAQGAEADDRPVLLACFASGAYGYSSGSDVREVAPAPWTLTVVDGATGRSLRTRTVEGTLINALSTEDDVILGTATADGFLRVTRWDPDSGELAWEWTSPEPIAPGGTVQGWELRDGFLVITGTMRVSVSVETGEPGERGEAVSATDNTVWMTRTDLGGGREAVWREGSGHLASEGEVLGPDGQVLFSLPGQVLRPHHYDGSFPEVLVVGAGAGIAAIDLADGERRWRSDEIVGSSVPLLQVDGVLVLQDGNAVHAVDVRDGAVRWSTPDGAMGYGSSLTDGELIDTSEMTGTQTMLVARDVQDGTVRWRAPVPEGFMFLQTTGSGAVLAATQDGVVALG